MLVAVAEEFQNTIGHRGIPSGGAEPAPNYGAGLEVKNASYLSPAAARPRLGKHKGSRLSYSR